MGRKGEKEEGSSPFQNSTPLPAFPTRHNVTHHITPQRERSHRQLTEDYHHRRSRSSVLCAVYVGERGGEGEVRGCGEGVERYKRDIDERRESREA